MLLCHNGINECLSRYLDHFTVQLLYFKVATRVDLYLSAKRSPRFDLLAHPHPLHVDLIPLAWQLIVHHQCHLQRTNGPMDQNVTLGIHFRGYSIRDEAAILDVLNPLG